MDGNEKLLTSINLHLETKNEVQTDHSTETVDEQSILSLWSTSETSCIGMTQHPNVQLVQHEEGVGGTCMKVNAIIAQHTLLCIPIAYVCDSVDMDAVMTKSEINFARKATSIDAIFITNLMHGNSENAVLQSIPKSWMVFGYANDLMACRQSPEQYHKPLVFTPRTALSNESGNCALVHGLLVSTRNIDAGEECVMVAADYDKLNEFTTAVMKTFDHHTRGYALTQLIVKQFQQAINRTVHDKLIFIQLNRFQIARARQEYADIEAVKFYHRLESLFVKHALMSADSQPLQLQEVIMPSSATLVPYAQHYLSSNVPREVVLCPLITALENRLRFINNGFIGTNFRLLHCIADCLSLLRSSPPVRQNVVDAKSYYTTWIESAGFKVHDDDARTTIIINMLVAAHDANDFNEVVATTLELVAGIVIGLMKHDLVVSKHQLVFDPRLHPTLKLFDKFQECFKMAYSYDALTQMIEKTQKDQLEIGTTTTQVGTCSTPLAVPLASLVYTDWELKQMQTRVEWRAGAIGLGHGLFKCFLETIVDPHCPWAQDTLHGEKQKYANWQRKFWEKVNKTISNYELPWTKLTWGNVKQEMDKKITGEANTFLKANYYGYYPGKQPDSTKESAICFHLSLRQCIVGEINKRVSDNNQPKLTTLAKVAYAAMNRIGVNTDQRTTNAVGVLSQSVISDFDQSITLLIEGKLPTAIAMERARNMGQALIPLLQIGQRDRKKMFSLLHEAASQSEKEEWMESVSVPEIAMTPAGSKPVMSWKMIADFVRQVQHIHT